MRRADIQRKTNETDITLSLSLDGTGLSDIQTGCGFFDHMLEQFTFHGMFDISARCAGDIAVDAHHTVEDVGITLGQAFREALGDKARIGRYGSCVLPMDETLMLCAADICNRPHLNCEVLIPSAKAGDFDTELVKEFFAAFTRALGLSLHFVKMAGNNSHHIMEAMFKSFGRAMNEACGTREIEGRIPSTKGML